MSAKAVSSKVTPLKKAAKKPVKSPKSDKKQASEKSMATSSQREWLQDASIEVPVPAFSSYGAGQRQLEFSVGMRQQEDENAIRSELRARALVHASGQVLVLVEASYVVLENAQDMRPDLPQYLYSQLKPHLENLFALSGHTPPLPETLEQAA